jgi:cytochrome c peroxidase
MMANKKSLLIKILFLLTIISMTNSCGKEEDDANENELPDAPYALEYGSLPAPSIPGDNPLTVYGVALGRKLFYEKALSQNNSISCASCHNQQTAFSDTNALSLGVGGSLGKRQAMGVFNTLWHTNEFFWDGRAHLLRDQALRPIQDSLEMRETLPNVINKLNNIAEYPTLFNKAFGTPGIDATRMSLALEQFMNSIVSYRSKYDDFLLGNATLTLQEERGRFLFFTEYNPAFPANSGADCQHCHSGANFENDRYLNNGLDTDANVTDYGREMVTGNAQDRAKFKVVSLRNIELTPPYMHDGRFNTLEEVIEHYNLVKQSGTLDPSFLQQLPGGLQLSQSDKDALVAFLKTLTDHTLSSDPRYSDPF